jgi:hypothetical protein
MAHRKSKPRDLNGVRCLSHFIETGKPKIIIRVYRRPVAAAKVAAAGRR